MKTLLLLVVLSFFLLTDVVAEEYKFGVTPWQRGQSEDEIKSLYKPMLNWLGSKTGHNFILVSTVNYDDTINNLANGKLDIASISPVPYVLAKRRNSRINLLVTELRSESDDQAKTDTYHSYILTLKKNKEIKTVQDLKNKLFGYVTRASTSGFIYPLNKLEQEGLGYKKSFKRIFFLGSHPGVTDAIKANSIDAGATWGFNWNVAKKKHGDIFKPIWKSPPIPNLAIVAHSSMPMALQEKIKKLLLSIKPELLDGIPAEGYVERSDSFYDGVRKAMSVRE